MSPLSIIVPVLDEAPGIAATLAALAPARARGVEVVVVDGGSRDDTRSLAAPLADRVIEAPRGRAAQMNAGARGSRGSILLFLHADTALPEDGDGIACAGLERTSLQWGRFDVAIAGADPLLALVALLMNARSRLTGIATGDQAIFVRREAFERVGGFPEIPLMEDVAFTKGLRAISRPLCLRERVLTSGRRWERGGTLRTIVLMWRLRLAYAFGADPHRLARRYDVERTSG
ncbi:MAG: TIGR04283 family arsenosugar biosynthesis glycosyltransferase [Usitatibacter sp.]